MRPWRGGGGGRLRGAGSQEPAGERADQRCGERDAMTTTSQQRPLETNDVGRSVGPGVPCRPTPAGRVHSTGRPTDVVACILVFMPKTKTDDAANAQGRRLRTDL